VIKRSHLVFGSLVLVAGASLFLWERSRRSSFRAGYAARPSGSLTFSKDIAPIVFENCSPCHRIGETSPFTLLNYDDVRKRAESIARVTQSRYMPPWLPVKGFAEFAHERLLTDEQIGMIQQWVAEGKKEGRPEDIPTPPRWTEGWQLGAPDLIARMPQDYKVPAEGKDIYRNFVIPLSLDAPKYVVGVEFRPGGAKVVHHAFISLDQTRESRRLDEKDAELGFSGIHTPPTAQSPEGHFLTWQPGKIPRKTDPSMAWTLEPGTDLVLQVHLQPSGKEEHFQPSIGFYFSPEKPSKTPSKVYLTSYSIQIPAGAANYAVEDAYTLPIDVDLLGVLPHAHYLARRMEVWATLPTGERRELLLIPNWDFNWQGDYEYKEPISLPKGTQLAMHFTYDNSEANVRNPNHPPKPVSYGLQTTDEMAEVWFRLLPKTPEDIQKLHESIKARLVRDGIAYNSYLLEKNPRDGLAHANLALRMLQLRRMDDALAHAKKGVELEPDNETVHYNLALVLDVRKQQREAEAEYARVLELNPDNLKARNNLGLLEYGRADFDGAEHQFREALRIKPGDPIAQSNLELVLRGRGTATPSSSQPAH